ncbi:VOC family protein [Nocardia bovistercoris]|uniref:VOC family protein n=1 Tax=Nocardia bovistercoris TaxID=2785916 RepID=A0A931N1Y2_9NOCA|nr:VOC family protein [Nocardia bovistercoris]MBH0775431.1 VOC family protein [Nocardia bovistercoris]
MTTPAINTVSWFQIGSDKPDEVAKFYGGLFGWTFAPDPNSDGYDLINYAGADGASGGIAHVPAASANHATFFVLVGDVAATVAASEKLGGTVLVPPTTSKDGLVFAHILDTSGNNFGVFTPAP